MYKVFVNNKPKIITENWEDFCSGYYLIKAAGGLVYNESNQLLMIFRNGKWDLPKGKVEIGENVRDAAVREVEEECGLSEITIDKHLSYTYHTYVQNNKHILKKTDWFMMTYVGKSEPIPQTSEGITKVQWFQNIEKPLQNTYQSIIEVTQELSST
jgi:8-oxo-dGTP pyrophosphatase MutT (NUDIX family)